MLGVLKQETKNFFKLKSMKLNFHLPILSSSCMGICLLTGLLLNNVKAGLTASMAALLVLYFPIFAPLSERIVTLLACAFAFILSYSIGVVFSFNHVISAIIFGFYTVLVHWVSSYLKLRPPKSFFFIMLAATASCVPYDLEKIPENIGLVAIGAIISATYAFVYSLIINKKRPSTNSGTIQITLKKNRYTDLIESLILGFFIFFCLELGYLLKIDNPYWIPVSCAAVMQGATRYHIWQRVAQRIVGTFIGLGLCWVILLVAKEMWLVCIAIIVLQFILELFVPRNYAIAVIFITPLTILLVEASDAIVNNASTFILIRFYNIVLGSMIGIFGGWLIYHEKIHYSAIKKIRKTRNILKTE